MLVSDSCGRHLADGLDLWTRLMGRAHVVWRSGRSGLGLETWFESSGTWGLGEESREDLDLAGTHRGTWTQRLTPAELRMMFPSPASSAQYQITAGREEYRTVYGGNARVAFPRLRAV